MRFIKLFIFCILIFSLGGCASSFLEKNKNKNVILMQSSSRKVEKIQEPNVVVEAMGDSQVIPTVEASPVTPQEVKIEKGLVFAKADFTGVLKAVYVRLGLENVARSDEQYHILIGDKSKQLPFMGNAEMPVEPGYFFLELPEGHYRINELSIPVGSTLASEPMYLYFDVQANKAVYLGSLQVIGTKEKMRLGGVPVLKPGFEYRVFVGNENAEALMKFKEKYPDFKADIVTNLIKIEKDNNQIKGD